jgi:hypothetical protein
MPAGCVCCCLQTSMTSVPDNPHAGWMAFQTLTKLLEEGRARWVSWGWGGGVFWGGDSRLRVGGAPPRLQAVTWG